MRRLVATVVASCLLTAALFVSSARADGPPNVAQAPEMQVDLAAAAAYWGESPSCPQGVSVIVDQSVVGTYMAKATVGGCKIWIGDNFASPAWSAGQRCQAITHEWGHLTGHDHVASADDPLGVMISFTMPAACAALDPPPSVTPAPARPYETPDQIEAYVKHSDVRRNRTECSYNASVKRHRKDRVRARKACVRRYGRVYS